MESYSVLGIMSGTSLDGVDLALCHFENNSEGWSFRISYAETIAYSDEWKKRLLSLPVSSAEIFVQTDAMLGKLFGEMVKNFCTKNKLNPDYISSHGHTIFHQPGAGFTSQIGNGAMIAATCGYPVVCDFRTLDVALGGQGAPLVPIGDQMLFSDYDYCLNLGGIANISSNESVKRVAFDICGCNQVLNSLANRVHKAYDAGGEMAAKGKIRKELLERLNSLPYYSQPFPKSLGREDMESDIFPMMDKPGIPLEDLLATFCEHIAIQISNYVKPGKMLVSGGGAFNTFLIERLRHHSLAEIVVPDPMIINFKEALIFAFLGLLRWTNKANSLSSVTGARHNHSGGVIWLPGVSK